MVVTGTVEIHIAVEATTNVEGCLSNALSDLEAGNNYSSDFPAGISISVVLDNALMEAINFGVSNERPNQSESAEE